MKTITLGFFLLLALILLVYWQGATKDLSAFSQAVVNVANNFTGRNAKGEFQGYSPAGSGTSPAPGSGTPTDPNKAVCAGVGGYVGMPCVYTNSKGQKILGNCFGGTCVSAFGN